MKQLLLILSTLLIFSSYAYSDPNYNDIVVYEVPSFLKGKAEDFLEKVKADKKTMYKTYSNTYVVVIKSKGYGIDMYEYILMNNYKKQIIPVGSFDYFKWNRRFEKNRISPAL